MSSSDSSATIQHPFTQSWIQALTAAAGSPVARSIKPKLEWIDHISLQRSDGAREAAAQELWTYAESVGLRDVLAIVPAAETRWEFPEDERFVFERQQPLQISNFDQWCSHLGLRAGEHALQAEVTQSDWTSWVRQEAVRLQQPFNAAAIASSLTLHVPCQALWDGSRWKLQFEDAEWLELPLAELAQVSRPEMKTLQETLTWAAAEADASLLPGRVSTCESPQLSATWISCIDSLQDWHVSILESPDFSAWLRRTWNCVWPTVYREQNVLRGQADIQILRSEMAACIRAVPELTSWMFVFAKLVCQTQTGMGLGICIDYT